MTLRRFVIITGIASLLIVVFANAAAGDSQLEPNAIRIQPGATVELTADVSRGASGWVEDGPFYVYLHGDAFGKTLVSRNGGSASDVPLGRLSVTPAGDHAAISLEVELPSDTPPGVYSISVCNDPCTTGLGDLSGGLIYIGVNPPDRNAAATVTGSGEEAAVDTYLALAPYPARRTGLSVAWVAISAGLAALVLAGSIFSSRWTRR